MEENNKLTNEEESIGNSKLKIWSISIGVFIFLSLVVVLIINSISKDFPLVKVLFWSGGVFLVAIGIFVSFYFLQKFNEIKSKKDDLPKESSIEELKELIKKIIESPNGYMNHIRSWGKMDTNDINKNIIYTFYPELEYDNEELGTQPKIIINAHYPESRISFLHEKAPTPEILRSRNSASASPKDDPDTEETVTENSMTGTKTTHKKVTPSNKKQKEKDKEKGDIR